MWLVGEPEFLEVMLDCDLIKELLTDFRLHDQPADWKNLLKVQSLDMKSRATE